MAEADPDFWNNPNNLQFTNNCYNYANNRPTGNFAESGVGSGGGLTALTCTNVKNQARRDGLTLSNCSTPCPSGEHKLSLVVAPGQDFHWYREHGDGSWSHKGGGAPARSTDASNAPVTDHTGGDRAYRMLPPGVNYTDFCGCFCRDCTETIQ